MARKEIDNIVSDELIGPFNTWSSDLLYNGEQEGYYEFCQKEADKIQAELDEMENTIKNEIVYDNEEWTKLCNEGKDEEADAKFEELEKVYEQKFEQVKLEAEQKVDSLDDIFDKEKIRIFRNHIEGFMSNQGYHDLNEKEIEFLMDNWRDAFEL